MQNKFIKMEQINIINEMKKETKEKGNKTNSLLNNFRDFHRPNFQEVSNVEISESTTPLTLNDLKIDINDNKNLKVKKFMTTFINNVFENKDALFLYCKYILLFYGKDLIDEHLIESVNFEIIKGGITNILVKVKDNLNTFKFVIRLYGPKTTKIINREREKKITKLISEINISKNIYIFFPNGRIEEYVEGYALSRENIKDKTYQKEIAIKLRLLHDIHISDDLFAKLLNLQNIKGTRVSFLWHTVWKYFNLLNDEKSSKHSFKDKKNILNLIDFEMLKHTIIQVEKLCSQKNSPIVLCHCDLLSSNIIKRDDGSICYIDFEYSCPIERAFDIANHFNEYAGFNCDWNLIPSKTEEYNFIKHYLNVNDEKLIYNLIDEIQPFYLSSHIIWGLWALLQAMNSKIDFDFVKYAIQRLAAVYSPIFRTKIDIDP